MSDGIVPLLSASAALLAVLALIAGGARLLRARSWLGQPRSGTGRLTLRESMALDPKRRLHLVQCGSRQVVLLTGGAQDLVVGWIEPER
jgi:flagellar protein FliO/FliZ